MSLTVDLRVPKTVRAGVPFDAVIKISGGDGGADCDVALFRTRSQPRRTLHEATVTLSAAGTARVEVEVVLAGRGVSVLLATGETERQYNDDAEALRVT